jgi:hypothetical protein
MSDSSLHSDAGTITAKARSTLFRSTFSGSILRRFDWLLVYNDRGGELDESFALIGALLMVGNFSKRRAAAIKCGSKSSIGTNTPIEAEGARRGYSFIFVRLLLLT